MQLSCADYSWPLLEHPHVIALIQALGLEGVDIGFFGNRSHLRPEVVRQDVRYWAGVVTERVERAGLKVADLFYQPWSDFARMAANHPDPQEQAESDELFHTVIEFALGVGAPGITMLPGLVLPGETPATSIEHSATKLRQRVQECGAVGLRLSVEGHLGSNVDSPAKLGDLVAQTPGLGLTLDYTHYISLGFTEDEIEPLQAHASHVQLRGAAPGRLQANYGDSTIDHFRLINGLRQRGYDGWIGFEYVWQDWMECNRSDNLSETIMLRDLVVAALRGEPYTPPPGAAVGPSPRDR